MEVQRARVQQLLQVLHRQVFLPLPPLRGWHAQSAGPSRSTSAPDQADASQQLSRASLTHGTQILSWIWCSLMEILFLKTSDMKILEDFSICWVNPPQGVCPFCGSVSSNSAYESTINLMLLSLEFCSPPGSAACTETWTWLFAFAHEQPIKGCNLPDPGSEIHRLLKELLLLIDYSVCVRARVKLN